MLVPTVLAGLQKVGVGFLHEPQGEDCLHHSPNAAAIAPTMDAEPAPGRLWRP